MLRALFWIAFVGCQSSRSARVPVDSAPPAMVHDAPSVTVPVDAVHAIDAMTDATIADASIATPDATPDATTDATTDAMPDATTDATTDAMTAPQPDAAATTPNTVTCYLAAAPTTTCELPTHCCFSNYDSQHQGQCSSAACTWGTISCDGPEDCGSGQRCCAHATSDPDQGLTGYTLACQTDPCGAAPANEELCHPGTTTCSSGTCVTAYGHDSDLPRTLGICQ